MDHFKLSFCLTRTAEYHFSKIFSLNFMAFLPNSTLQWKVKHFLAFRTINLIVWCCYRMEIFVKSNSQKKTVSTLQRHVFCFYCIFIWTGRIFFLLMVKKFKCIIRKLWLLDLKVQCNCCRYFFLFKQKQDTDDDSFWYCWKKRRMQVFFYRVVSITFLLIFVTRDEIFNKFF